jgi:sarcosine oxidase subunit alpha
MSALRLPQGGLIDRSRTLGFTFDGRALRGHPGDTLASALLANDVYLVGRSFKYHRPRGILAAGVEETNAIVSLGDEPRVDTNTRATTVELQDGLTARSLHRWPSLRWDVGALSGALSGLLVAGF